MFFTSFLITKHVLQCPSSYQRPNFQNMIPCSAQKDCQAEDLEICCMSYYHLTNASVIFLAGTSLNRIVPSKNQNQSNRNHQSAEKAKSSSQYMWRRAGKLVRPSRCWAWFNNLLVGKFSASFPDKSIWVELKTNSGLFSKRSLKWLYSVLVANPYLHRHVPLWCPQLFHIQQSKCS